MFKCASCGKRTILNYKNEEGKHYCRKCFKALQESKKNESLYLGDRIKKKDLHELDSVLSPDETLQGAFSGTVLGRMSSFKAQWLVVTDKHVIFHGRAFVGGGSDVFPYNEVSSVQGKRGLLLGSIQLNIKGKTEVFGNMQKNEVEHAVNLIRKNIAASESTPMSSVDPLDQLKKLKELLDANIITEEEYAEKRNKLLAKI